MELSEILSILRDAGLLGGTIFALWGFRKGWWVFGREHEDVVRQRDEYKDMVFRALGATERVADAVDMVVQRRRDNAR